MSDSSSGEELDEVVRRTIDDQLRLDGLAIEQACKFLAYRRRGWPANKPTTVRVKDAGSVYVDVRGDTQRRRKAIKAALNRAIDTMETVFKALAYRRVSVRISAYRCV